MGFNSEILFTENSLDTELIKTKKYLDFIRNDIPKYLNISKAFIEVQNIENKIKEVQDILTQEKRQSSDICNKLSKDLSELNIENYNLDFLVLSKLFDKYELRETRTELLKKVKSTGKPVLISSGMSTMDEIDKAIEILGQDNTVLFHCTSTYPTDNNETNLNVIPKLIEKYNCPIGYSGHERGILPSSIAVVLGACAVERHITLDRTNWGSDQAASLEMAGLYHMVRDIRQVPDLLGDGNKIVYPRELPIIEKLRRI
jgi:hypothetical protein